MSMLALDQTASKREGGNSAAKAWLRALEATAPIAANPQRTLPIVIEELAESFGDAPALISDGEMPDLSGAGRARQPLCALGARARHRAGRYGLPA